MTLPDLLQDIAASISRRKGNWGVVASPGGFTLAAGVGTSSLAPGVGVVPENVSVNRTADDTALLFSISLCNTSEKRTPVRIFVYDESDPQAIENRTRQRIISAEQDPEYDPDDLLELRRQLSSWGEILRKIDERDAEKWFQGPIPCQESR